MHILNVDPPSGGLPTGRSTYIFNNWRGHGEQVANLARDMALQLGLSEGEAARVEKAARYHDIGKSKLPNLFDGLDDQPEELSRSERELLMSHTWLGYRMLQNAPNPDSWVADTALLHHEWWNGTGYPLGVAQTDIPLAARIVSVANLYGTLLEQRPCAGAWHVEDVLTAIRGKSGTQFDPECVEALDTLMSRSDVLALHTQIAAGIPAN